MRVPFRWITLLAVLLLAACSSGSNSGPAPRDRARITEAEIEALPGGMNAYEAVQRLRPFWLTVRANRSFTGQTAEVLVYQGEMRLGDVDNLKNIRASEVQWFEFLDPSQAIARLTGLGNSRPAGVIIVHMQVG